MIYNDELHGCKADLENKTLCMVMVGWQKNYNEPNVCLSLTKQCCKVISVDNIDTSGSSHTGNYLEIWFLIG